MDRLTYYDHFCGCFKLRPDAPQGQIIQQLGAYETKTEDRVKAISEKAIDEIKAEATVDFSATKNESWIDGYNEALRVCIEHIEEVSK